MNTVKALIFCNNPVALPGIREFLFFGKAGAIVTTQRNKEMQHILQLLLKDSDTPLLLVNKKNYREIITDAIHQYGINVGLVMTFPFILPQEILDLPARGFINFHYGLLPQCRGPQPILRHLLNNDTHTGVTVHKMDAGIDTGPVILQEKMPIETDDTYGTLQGKLAQLAAKQAANLLKILSYGTILPATAQDESEAAYYEMPGAGELTINWEKMPPTVIIRLINACNPWNKGAGTAIQGWMFGVLEAEPAGQTEAAAAPGTILACNATEGLLVQCCNGEKIKINIVYTQEGFLSGWRLAGFGIAPGQVLGG